MIRVNCSIFLHPVFFSAKQMTSINLEIPSVSIQPSWFCLNSLCEQKFLYWNCFLTGFSSWYFKATITMMQHVNPNFDQLFLKVFMLSRLWLFATPHTVALQAPMSMELSRQKYWSGLHVLLQGIFPTRDWTQVSCISGRFFTIWATSEACCPRG